MEVYICNRCGLCQSFSTTAYQSRPVGSMSADADRSSYRYTKDIISGRYEKCFKKCVDFSMINKVLDVGSNRGAFIDYLDKNYPGKNVIAIEPDPSVTSAYATYKNVSLQLTRFEHANLPEKHFDFSYCAHTLEHADSARGMLYGIWKALKPGGLLFLAVPNLIFYQDIIEEIFIDPHTYHFNYFLLKDFVSHVGYTLIWASNSLDPDVVFLLQKKSVCETSFHFAPSNSRYAEIAKEEVLRYANEIHSNRRALKRSVAQLNDAGNKNKIVIWGGGRILDALIRFGGLDLSKIYVIVDKYLHRYVSALHGVSLKSPSFLRDETKENIIVYIASRDYAQEIRLEAENMGLSKFINFGTSIKTKKNEKNRLTIYDA